MGINAEYMGTHPIFESDFDCLTEMKLFVLTYFATGALGRAKDIKQEMMKNRLKFDRDIVLTSPDDDEEWDPWDLEDEELQARLRKLVARMDRNRDGYIDNEELTTWTLVSLYNIAGQDSHDDFSFVDENGNDSISWSETSIEAYDIDPEDKAAIKEELETNTDSFREYNKMYNRDRARFDAADIDKDGKLTEGEFLLFKNPLKDENVKQVVIDEALKAVDSNGDGQIDLQEYLNDWHEPPNTNDDDFIELETDRFNDEYDRNKDGFLIGDELLFWLSPDNTEIAIDEAEHLIDMCDEDEDERLTPDEIVENHDLWVDSDATEYGAQLRHYDEL